MNNEFVGKVRTYTDKSGTKKDGTAFTAWQIVLDEEVDRYPDSLVADYYGEKLTPPEVNSVIRVGYHVRSSEWNGKFFGQNSIWKIDSLEAASTQQNESPTTPQNIPPVQAYTQEESDDLPF